MKYYFDIRGDGLPARDHVGRDFDIPSAAIAYARELADGLRTQKALIGQNMRVCVVTVPDRQCMRKIALRRTFERPPNAMIIILACVDHAAAL